MKQFIFLILISFWFASTGTAQTEDFLYINYRGDTVIYQTVLNPTVCDCHKSSGVNTDQKRICAKKYDYDFMSKEEKQTYDFQLKICKHPSICDCAKADMQDKGLIKSCDQNYLNPRWIDQEKREQNLMEMRACKEENRTIYRLQKEANTTVELCECINIPSYDYKKKKKCDETFLDEKELGEDVVKKNLESMQKCAENMETSLNPTICDCAQFAATDEEFEKACRQKFEKAITDSLQREDYEAALELCSEYHLYLRIKTIRDSVKQTTVFENEVEKTENPPLASPRNRKTEERLEDLVKQLEQMKREANETAINYRPDPTPGNLKNWVENKILTLTSLPICACSNLEKEDSVTIRKCLREYPIQYLSAEEFEQLSALKKRCAKEE